MPGCYWSTSWANLGAWWGTAQIAFVGGSMGNRGGQNMIEPAAYGAAVSFGPNTRNFRDIVSSLLEADAAVASHDEAALEQFVRRCLEENGYIETLGGRAEFVGRQLGATGELSSCSKGCYPAQDEKKAPRKGRNAA